MINPDFISDTDIKFLRLTHARLNLEDGSVFGIVHHSNYGYVMKLRLTFYHYERNRPDRWLVLLNTYQQRKGMLISGLVESYLKSFLTGAFAPVFQSFNNGMYT